ncbi:MAG: hypothetical protein RL300_362 [Pseudomonadota bacterium]|jgi:quinol monooxygenase YgiN
MSTPAKIAVMGHLRFPPDRMVDILPHLRRLVETTNREDGCITYQVAIDPFDPGVIRFSELWPDAQTLDRHIAAAHVVPWREAQKNCGVLERQYMIYDITGARSV